MSQVMVHLGGVAAVLITMVFTQLFAPGLAGWSFWGVHAVAFVLGTVVWVYSPLPDNNIIGTDQGRYWGWSGSKKTNNSEAEAGK